jgi:hypothetical protein
MSISKLWGPSKMAYFILGYFSTKIITWKFHWNLPRNKRYRVNIVQRQMYRKTWFYTTKHFIFAKHVPKLAISHCRKKLILGKNKFVCDWSSRFCSTYPNICDRPKIIRYTVGYLTGFTTVESEWNETRVFHLLVYNNIVLTICMHI